MIAKAGTVLLALVHSGCLAQNVDAKLAAGAAPGQLANKDQGSARLAQGLERDEREIWPQPLSASYGAEHLHVDTAPESTAVLAWQVLGGGAVGPVLQRAIQRCEDALEFSGRDTGATDFAAPGVHERTRPPSRFTLALDYWSEELVDAVDESYSLHVNATGVALAAKTVWGARHALDSLAQLGRARAGGASFRHAVVLDEPQYQYRGLMVSPGQRFMPPALLATHLDGMEIARLNVLHFHLSEFCRYAVESKAFPALSANLSSGLNEGFYTWADINTLVAEAKKRGIRVIPEYDVPGHQARNMGVLDEMKWCGSPYPI
jgi:hexosaminidase